MKIVVTTLTVALLTLAQIALTPRLTYAADSQQEDSWDPARERRKAEDARLAKEDRTFIYHSLERSEPLAWLLSMTVGCGAGNFYAGASEVAIGLCAAQVTVTVVGVAFAQNDSGKIILASLGIRLIDAILAAMNTSDYNDELQRHLQMGNIRPQLTLTPGPRLQPEPATPALRRDPRLEDQSLVAGLSIRF